MNSWRVTGRRPKKLCFKECTSRQIHVHDEYGKSLHRIKYKNHLTWKLGYERKFVSIMKLVTKVQKLCKMKIKI